MEKLAVIREINSNGSVTKVIEEVNIADILLFRLEDRKIVYYTKDNQKYYDISSLDERRLHLEEFGFIKFDNTEVVNTNHIVSFDEKYYLLHLSGGQVANVARWRVKNNEELQKLLQKYKTDG
jgi:DNA-binding LytR/AlgR family response regulator